jgi:hypothetical protein
VDLSDPSDDRRTLFELKEKAKWSSDPEEKKAAIKKLSNSGEDAIFELQEIMSVTSDEDIKSACAEAIKSMRATLSSSSSITNRNSNNNNDSASQSNVGLNILLDSAHESYVKGDYKKADIFFEKVLEIEPRLESLGVRDYRKILFLKLLITLLLLHYYDTTLGSSLATSTVNLTSFHEYQSSSSYYNVF